MNITSKIKQHERGTCLIDLLIAKFKYLTPDQWKERVSEGRFSIEGVILNEESILHTNDILIYDCPPFVEPDADLNYSIVFETEQFLAVNKTGNLLVHKKGAAITHNLIYQLRECHEPPFPTADIVNRLDRETSGLVLISKDKPSLKKLSQLFMDRTIEKEYLAVVHGIPEKQSGVITASLKPSEEGKIRSKQVVSDDGKLAETRYEVVQSWKDFSLLRLWPKTGRTHQLRVHCKYLGHTIVGDKLYGLTEEQFIRWQIDPEEYGELEFPRQALHCCSLKFEWEGNEMIIEAPVPEDMNRLIPSA